MAVVHDQPRRWWMCSSMHLLILSAITYGAIHYHALMHLREADYWIETGSRNTILANFKNGHVSSNNLMTAVSYMHEANVFRSLLGRLTSIADECGAIDQKKIKAVKKKVNMDNVTLPERGLRTTLEKWLFTHDYTKDREYPMCHLPPTNSCNVTSYSVIIMSHTISDERRLGKMFLGIQSLASRPRTAEIILVWNGPKEVLTNGTHRYVQKLLYHANDKSHPLRIFYSLENGLQNNLLNRYNPALKPAQELIMYYDDDGPFFTEEAMEAGMKLWQFNSDTQVGSMPRNLRFSSDRMRSMQQSAAELAVNLATNDAWQTQVSPNDISKIASHRDVGSASNEFPAFIPICHSETGDIVEYNYNHFPTFEAHMSLPSGTFLHRNFLCFIWHPAFAELRQFILDHPTHPDDMVISTLVSHLSGKGLRTFPRRINKSKDETIVLEDEREPRSDTGVDQSRRRLLWQQDKWGDMREDAINIILNYFGSINPGSIGWCTGTKYCIKGGEKSESLYTCDPEFPIGLKDVPWMNEGGLGHNICG